jgi:hypothetical protein
MGVPTSEVGYPSATTRRGDHEVHDGHVGALGNNNNNISYKTIQHHFLAYVISRTKINNSYP